MSDTPETDAAVVASGGDWSPVLRAVAQRLERERDEWYFKAHANFNFTLDARAERDEALIDRANGDIATMTINHYERILRERDEAREKIKRQAERIRELEGATNHAGGLQKSEPKFHGTDETDAIVELWESNHIPADFARRIERERNKALELAHQRLTQLTAITSSEPPEYLGLVIACKVHKDHIAQLAKERDEALSVADTLSGIASAYLGWHLSRTPHGADDRSLEVARNVTAAIKRWKELKR